MRTLFHKLVKGKEKWSFQRADLTEGTQELKNPSRGWYQIYAFEAEKEPDFSSISWCGTDEDTLALVIIDIGAYREKALDEKALKNIREVLCFFAEKGYDLILRMVYDHQGNALEREPFFFEQVKEHLEQLLPIVKEFVNHIFVFQGMLIGNWGEMHTSRFLAPTKLKELWKILQEELKQEVFYAVRKPSQWRLLHPQVLEKETAQFACDNMGLFDDAIFGSWNHLGTFGTETKENAGWEKEWRREDELDFEEKLCQYVPNGGEALLGEDYPQAGDVKDIIEVLRKMHITYLNKYYDEKLLQLWKNQTWEVADVWQNCSVYDYISRHLGYRFWVKDVDVSPSKQGEKNLQVTILIENVGFANIYHETEVFLEYVDAEKRKHKKQLTCDLQSVNSGEIQEFSCEIERMECRLYLTASRKKDGRGIAFANQQSSRVFLGQITDKKVKR